MPAAWASWGGGVIIKTLFLTYDRMYSIYPYNVFYLYWINIADEFKMLLFHRFCNFHVDIVVIFMFVTICLHDKTRYDI